jgi:glyoxylase-like metal-dependent hydrolase (beta-lactamase superfamily II)
VAWTHNPRTDGTSDAAHPHQRSRRPCEGEGVPPWVVPISVPTPYPIGPVTLYLLEGEPLTLVDTGPGTGSAWSALQRALRARSLEVGDIQRVLITHGHHDHFGLAHRMAQLGADLLAHSHDRRNLARTARPVSDVKWLLDRQELPHEHGPITVHHLPGHTPGHVGFELGELGVVITGDTILDGITPNAVVDADPENPEQPFLSLAAYAAALVRLEGLQPTLLLPAHGPCISDVKGQIAKLRERQARRATEIHAAISSGPVTVASLITQLFPGVRLLNIFLAFSEVLGNLLELERRGLARRVSADRVERWESTR